VKQILETIQVQGSLQDGLLFAWRNQLYRVTQVSDRWFYRGKWWMDPQLVGETRAYMRVVCRAFARNSVPPKGGTLVMAPGPYSMTRLARKSPELGPERVMEIFHRCRPQGQDWVLSKVVD